MVYRLHISCILYVGSNAVDISCGLKCILVIRNNDENRHLLSLPIPILFQFYSPSYISLLCLLTLAMSNVNEVEAKTVNQQHSFHTCIQMYQ